MFLDRIVEPVLALPRIVKRSIALVIDAGLCVLTVWLAFYLRLGEFVTLSGGGWPAAVASLLIALPVFTVLGLYRAVFRYVGWDALTAIASAVVIYGIIYSAIFTAFGIDGVPRTVGIIQPILLFIAIGGSRVVGRYWLGGGYRQRLRRHSKKNVVIYGSGLAGRQLAAAMVDGGDLKVVAFVDDDKGLHGSNVGGVRVWSADRLEALVEKYDVAEVLLAIPSATRKRRNEILQQISDVGVAVRTLPGFLDVAYGKVTVNDLRPLEIEDLLGRDPIAPERHLLEGTILGKVVMVTGAGGSIGGELCRQILQLRPARLLLVDSSEYALYAIHRTLTEMAGDHPGPAVEIVPLLASVCDEARMERIFKGWRPATVYHAAAYKHVPLVEHNVVDGVRNNVAGTWICARLAQKFGAESFVLVSTDKAVRPTNVMGASKRLAEMILQAHHDQASQTRFSMVRFGNVLGSSGSVVPLFRRQISSGGPVTVTHREIIRYFMTISEAAQLVLQAGSMARGGEVFVLDMGSPVRVFDLARRMIELAGLQVRDEDNPDGDIEIVFTGLRPGEKLYEELLIGENPVATGHPRIMMASEEFLPMVELEPMVEQLGATLSDQNVVAVRQLLCNVVPAYSPSNELVDWSLSTPPKAPLRIVRDSSTG